MASAPAICDHCKIDSDLKGCCLECEQMYCADCSSHHRLIKATRHHTIVDASNNETNFTHSNINQECSNKCGNVSVGLCIDCKQVFCEDCISKHSTLKVTENHKIIAAKVVEPLNETEYQLQRRSSIISTSHSEMVQAQAQQQKGTYEGFYNTEFMSSAPGDKELTRVRGIAFLFDEKTWKIIVADYKNRSLKLFNMNLQHITSKDLKEDPRGIVAISNNQVAVTIADKKEIRIFKVDSKKIKRFDTIKLKENPYSIAFDKDHLAVETGESDDGAIRILNVSGKEKYVISGSTRSFGQFSGNTIRLALDFSKSMVFVVDIAKEYIHCVGFNNTMHWSVPMKSPRGITLYKNTLFIASSEKNRIFQMNATDGTSCHLLDEHNNRVRRPRYIAFIPKFQTLAVEIDGNHIKLYKITTLTT